MRRPIRLRADSTAEGSDPLDVVRLTPLMERTRGRPQVTVALIDGPIVIGHSDLPGERIAEIPSRLRGTCARANSAACMHGTFVAGILSAKTGSAAPGICPDCTLLVRPIFRETATGNANLPSATLEELAAAIIDAIEGGARLINLSAALTQASPTGERALEAALDHALRCGVITVAAAGNQGTVGGSAIARHRWVIPVVACDRQGRPMRQSNLGNSIGRRGLSAPGDGITSLGTGDRPLSLGGTSAAAPFVTGAIALLWSEFPAASPSQVKLAVTQASVSRRTAVVPPVLDAWAAYEVMTAAQARG
jgi:subtilisin family serine protease